MSTTLPLHTMIRSVIDGAKEKLAAEKADEKTGKLLRYEKKEHGHIPTVAEEKAEKGEGHEKVAALTDPSYIEKLASSVDFIAENIGDIVEDGPIVTALSKMAEESGSPRGSGKGPGALPQNKPTGGHQSYKKDHPAGDDAAASQAGTALSTGENGKGKTQLENNMHAAPGQNSGSVPTAKYPAKGPLVNNGKAKTASAAAEEHILLALASGDDGLEKDAGMAGALARPMAGIAAKPAAAAAKKVVPGAAHAAAAAAKPLGTAAGGGAVPSGHWGEWANKMAHSGGPALATGAKALVRGAAKPAAAVAKPLGTAVGGGAVPKGHWGEWANKMAGEDASKASISAKGGASPLAGKGQLQSMAGGQAAPKAAGGPTSGFGNEGRRHVSSADAAINLKKKDAKSPVKSQLGQVIDEPAFSRAHDSKVHENLRNADKGGVKIAAARTHMAKIAAGGCTCGGKGECEFDLLKEAAERARGKVKAANSMNPSSYGASSGPGMGGGSMGGGGGGMGATAAGGVGADGCTCADAGECRVCLLKAELAAAQAEALGGAAPGGVPPVGAAGAAGGAPAGAGAMSPMGA